MKKLESDMNELRSRFEEVNGESVDDVLFNHFAERRRVLAGIDRPYNKGVEHAKDVIIKAADGGATTTLIRTDDGEYVTKPIGATGGSVHIEGDVTADAFGSPSFGRSRSVSQGTRDAFEKIRMKRNSNESKPHLKQNVDYRGDSLIDHVKTLEEENKKLKAKLDKQKKFDKLIVKTIEHTPERAGFFSADSPIWRRSNLHC